MLLPGKVLCLRLGSLLLGTFVQWDSHAAFVDTDVGAHVLFFRSEIGCGNAFDCDSDLGPGANLFRMVRRALGGVLSPGGYVQLSMAATVIGAERLPVACARHRAPSLLFVLQMMLVYVF